MTLCNHEHDFAATTSRLARTPDPLQNVPDDLKRATARLFSDGAALERAVRTVVDTQRAATPNRDPQRERVLRERRRADDVLRDRWLSDCVRLAEQVSESDIPQDARMVLMSVLGSINERIAAQPQSDPAQPRLSIHHQGTT